MYPCYKVSFYFTFILFDICFRELQGLLVQEIKVYNSGDRAAQLSLEKLGIYQWDKASSQSQVSFIY